MKRSLLAFALASSMLAAVPAAQADVTQFRADLSGANESPSNTSLASGVALNTIDDLAGTMHLNVTFSDLVGTSTASHIHCCTDFPLTGTAGVATTVPTFAGFPLGVHSGTYDATLDLTMDSSYNPSFITANGGTTMYAEAALLANIISGQAYLNVHSSAFPSGEIRGFIVAVPEPSIWAMLGLGLAGIMLLRRKLV